MPNNGYGTGIYFANPTTTTAASGSVLSFKLKHQADKKELTDNYDNFIYVGITKRKKVASLEVLLQGSGSAITLANIGDTATIANPWTTEVAGNWGVTDAELDFKNDDGAKQTLELTQWTTTAGSLP
jgi:hypothetical protein